MVGSAATGGPVPDISDDEIAELEALYALVPPMQCLGLCQAACGPISMGDGEYARLQGPGMPPIAISDVSGLPGNLTCPALTILGQCAVYPLRPMICRIWGAIASMACPHHCIPEGGFLPELDGLILIQRSMMVGAPPRIRREYQALIDRISRDASLVDAMSLWIATGGHTAIPEGVQDEIKKDLETAATGGVAAGVSPMAREIRKLMFEQLAQRRRQRGPARP